METANQQARQPREIHVDLEARETAWEIAPDRSRMVRILIALAVVFAGSIGLACAMYPPEYVYRVFVWRDAEADDYTRFPMRRIAAAQPVTPLPRGDESPAVRAAWRAAGGTADMEKELADIGTQAFLVVHHGRIVYERYFNGTSRHSWVTSFSVAKSVTSVLIGIAISEGAIGSIDDPVTLYLPELAQRDPRFKEIRLRHLVDMAAGIHYKEFPFLNGDDAKAYYWPNLRRLVLDHSEIDSEPGQFFQYNNYHPLLLGMVLERATHMPVARYLQEKLWKPAGMVAEASWSLDSVDDGFEKMESGINARAEDFARFGLLMLQQGRIGGRQVVPEGWVKASTSPSATPEPRGYYEQSVLRDLPRAYYHHFWWGRRRDDGRHDFAARGNLGQVVYVSPANDVVVVRHGWRYGIEPARWSARALRIADQLATNPG
jgi:CubicO group peptidase (beta-lactamase class C family)